MRIGTQFGPTGYSDLRCPFGQPNRDRSDFFKWESAKGAGPRWLGTATFGTDPVSPQGRRSGTRIPLEFSLAVLSFLPAQAAH